MSYDMFKLKLGRSDTIFDMLVVCYEYIDNSSYPGLWREYCRYLEEDNCNKWLSLPILIDHLLYGIIDFISFRDGTIDLFTEDKAKLFSIHLLREWDVILGDRDNYPYLKARKVDTNLKTSIGPLNKQDEIYSFIYTSNNSLLTLAKEHFRSVSKKDSSNIFYRIKNYRIIKKDLNLPKIILESYKNNYFKELLDGDTEELKIGVVPIGRKDWFRLEFQSYEKAESNFFEIKPEVELIEELNNRYISILELLNEERAHIVIFPELAMNKNTEKVISDYLINKCLMGTNYIQFVFMGSLWESGSNICSLISGGGTHLISNPKKMPFEYKKSGKTYVEALNKWPEAYNLLDVAGLGRLFYLVCKDGIDDNTQIELWNKYDVNFEVVSAYSPSLDYFIKQSYKFNSEYMGLYILNNCCEPRVRKNINKNINIGYLASPVFNEVKNNMDSQKNYYFTDDFCKSCSYFCNCAFVYTLNPNQIVKNNDMIGIDIKSPRKVMNNFA